MCIEDGSHIYSSSSFPHNLMTSLHSNSEYILAKKSLGQGSYSIVYECKSRSNGRHCAAKKYRKKLVYGMESLLQSELEILKSVSKSHKHILSLIDYFETKDCFYLLTDLAQGGDLYDRIVNGSTCGRLNDSKARNIVSQLVSAVAFLHSNNIVHRDIKTENIFFQAIGEDDDSILLGDFGLAKVLKPGERLHDISGTLSYMAPEMFDRKAGYSYPIDVWAIGVCLYFMLGGYLPFDCETDEETKDAIMGKKYLMEPSEYWTGVSENAKAFILDCFRDEENGERPSSSELKNKPFLIEGNVILPSPVEGNTTATATATYRTISTQDCQQIKNILLANVSSKHQLNFSSQLSQTCKKNFLPSPECVTELNSPVHSQEMSRETSMVDLQRTIDPPSITLSMEKSQCEVAKFVL